MKATNILLIIAIVGIAAINYKCFYHKGKKEPKYSLIVSGKDRDNFTGKRLKITYYLCLKTDKRVLKLPVQFITDKDTLEVLQEIKIN